MTYDDKDKYIRLPLLTAEVLMKVLTGYGNFAVIDRIKDSNAELEADGRQDLISFLGGMTTEPDLSLLQEDVRLLAAEALGIDERLERIAEEHIISA